MRKYLLSIIAGVCAGIGFGVRADPLIAYSFAATTASTSTTPSVRDVARIRGQGVEFAVTNSQTNAVSFSLVAVSGTYVNVSGPITLVASQRLVNGAGLRYGITNSLYNDVVRMNLWLSDGQTNQSVTGLLLMKQ